jgi:arabinose-5-phosphate isomerase
MDPSQTAIAKGREVVRIEGRAVAELEGKIGESFARAVDLVQACRGRVIVTGVGKSGIIARKIVATMNSTGTPSVFLHPTDAVHGDLGIVRDGDVVICISKSGSTAELSILLPMFRRIGVPVISLVGNLSSPLASESDGGARRLRSRRGVPARPCADVIDDRRAGARGRPRDRAPGPAAVYTGGFRPLPSRRDAGQTAPPHDRRAHDTGAHVPCVTGDVPLRDAIVEMTSKRLGCTCVLGPDGKLEGLITDGDLRRLLQKTADVATVRASDAMTRNPKTVRQGTLAYVVLQEMESYNITQMIVVDPANVPVGVVHLHDLVKAGLGGDDAG